MTSIHRFGWTSLALLALAGCEAPIAPPATPTTSTAPPAGPTGAVSALKPLKPVDGPVEPAKLSDAELAEIKKLPADEQPLAIAQMTCPVSGDHLGEMGAPIKQTIGDKSFYICCAGCEKAVKSKPDDVLAKLNK